MGKSQTCPSSLLLDLILSFGLVKYGLLGVVQNNIIRLSTQLQSRPKIKENKCGIPYKHLIEAEGETMFIYQKSSMALKLTPPLFKEKPLIS